MTRRTNVATNLVGKPARITYGFGEAALAAQLSPDRDAFARQHWNERRLGERGEVAAVWADGDAGLWVAVLLGDGSIVEVSAKAIQLEG